mgnify:CR=1 FL=1
MNIENVVKGKSRYSKATVAYSYNGEAKTQNIMSFANPDVFKKVQELVGQECEITLTKNAAGYNEWSAIGEVGSAPVQGTEAPTGTPVGTGAAVRVTGSNYETPAERAIKQVFIVKQSSITAALTLLDKTGAFKPGQDNISMVLHAAQQFVDYVFDKEVVE